ncbi:hypothetical protein LTR66_003039 [Elasticomyces elasticus]|nr:hypothetical protein LTR66_003039 [Elasticomyces elasticus]
MDRKVVGCLGGGQLGRMLVEAANRLNIQVNFLDAPNAPAKQISAHEGHIDGSFKDRDSIKKLAGSCDVVTVEIEHVDTYVLEEISSKVAVEPSWKTIRCIQDKYAQKEHLIKNMVATAESVPISNGTRADIERVGQDLGYPFMLKSRTEAYDGRGNFPVRSEADIDAALEALGSRPLYAEKWANFKAELAVMVVKTKASTLAFPTVETVHEDSICKLVYAPARNISHSVANKAQELAKRAVACFEGRGVFGVEMFLLEDESLLVNEIAPRPHNSGHYTIEACPISQYEAHLRAILDYPIPEESLEMREPAIMLNILGGSSPDSHDQVARKALSNARTSIHLYGKGESRKGRKMGHVTVTAATMKDAEKLIQPLIDAVDEARGTESDRSDKTSRIINSGTERRPAKGQRYVAVNMGSDSDLSVLVPGIEILESFGVFVETRITSAHRTPSWMAEFASSAADRGVEVIIAAAGGAAHLPGMTASETVLPVIGVPIKPTVGDGMDSVLSILNMPKGIPVATVSVNNSTNAALLAVRILGVADIGIRKKYQAYVENMAKEVKKKDAQLLELGPVEYRKQMVK